MPWWAKMPWQEWQAWQAWQLVRLILGAPMPLLPGPLQVLHWRLWCWVRWPLRWLRGWVLRLFRWCSHPQAAAQGASGLWALAQQQGAQRQPLVQGARSCGFSGARPPSPGWAAGSSRACRSRPAARPDATARSRAPRPAACAVMGLLVQECLWGGSCVRRVVGEVIVRPNPDRQTTGGPWL